MPLHLVDTNILIGLTDRTAQRYAATINAVQTLQAAGHLLETASQNLMEFWRVATRPAANNGLGLTLAAAQLELNSLEGIFPRLVDTDTIYGHWRQLITTVGVSGVQVHDARLVALMQAHGITHILTFNVGDFTRYIGPAGITIVDPHRV